MSTELSTQRAMGVPLHEERYNGEQQASVASPTLTRKATRNHWRALITVATLVVLCGTAGVWYAYSRQYATGDATATDQHGVNSGKATLRYVSDVAANSDNSQRDTGETVSVEVIAIPSRLRVTGTLTADAQSSVASNVNGIVTEVRVDRGSVVKKRDVLVQLDATDAQNRLTEGLALVDELKAKLTFSEASEVFAADEQPAVKLAVAHLALAKSRQSRADALAAQKAISVDECEQARSECECAVQRHRQALQEARQDHQAYLTAVASLAALRKAVADTTIVAPFDGLVVEKHVAVGEQVTGGFIASKVVTLVRIDPLRVSVTVPQQSVGQVVRARSSSFRSTVIPTGPSRAKSATSHRS